MPDWSNLFENLSFKNIKLKCPCFQQQIDEHDVENPMDNFEELRQFYQENSELLIEENNVVEQLINLLEKINLQPNEGKYIFDELISTIIKYDSKIKLAFGLKNLILKHTGQTNKCYNIIYSYGQRPKCLMIVMNEILSKYRGTKMELMPSNNIYSPVSLEFDDNMKVNFDTKIDNTAKNICQLSTKFCKQHKYWHSFVKFVTISVIPIYTAIALLSLSFVYTDENTGCNVECYKGYNNGTYTRAGNMYCLEICKQDLKTDNGNKIKVHIIILIALGLLAVLKTIFYKAEKMEIDYNENGKSFLRTNDDNLGKIELFVVKSNVLFCGKIKVVNSHYLFIYDFLSRLKTLGLMLLGLETNIGFPKKIFPEGAVIIPDAFRKEL